MVIAVTGLRFARDKPAHWKTRVKRAAKKSILSPEAFPVSDFVAQPAEMTECVDCGKNVPWYGWIESTSIQSAWEGDVSHDSSLLAQSVDGA